MSVLPKLQQMLVNLSWRLSVRMGWLALCISLSLAVASLYLAFTTSALNHAIFAVKEEVALASRIRTTQAMQTPSMPSAKPPETVEPSNTNAAAAMLSWPEFVAHCMSPTQMPTVLRWLSQQALRQQLALNIGDYQWQTTIATTSKDLPQAPDANPHTQSVKPANVASDSAMPATLKPPSDATAQTFSAVDMRFVLRGPYSKIKQWVAASLNHFPMMALSSIEFQRNEVSDPFVQATIVLTVYVKGEQSHGGR